MTHVRSVPLLHRDHTKIGLFTGVEECSTEHALSLMTLRLRLMIMNCSATRGISYQLSDNLLDLEEDEWCFVRGRGISSKASDRGGAGSILPRHHIAVRYP